MSWNKSKQDSSAMNRMTKRDKISFKKHFGEQVNCYNVQNQVKTEKKKIAQRVYNALSITKK